tara:strand:+ start:259 stop:702 length:444 start_codon:yes stop_codon:yes gene_type:complete
MRYAILTSLIPFLSLGMMVIANSAVAESKLARIEVTDHFKQVYHKTPHNVEVCYDKTVSGDKTGDALMGAIIGGIIGNNVTKDLPDGGTAGAIIGGMLGHNNSTAKSGTKTVCQVETRYTEQKREMYSHSTVTFTHDGKTYTLKFVR